MKMLRWFNGKTHPLAIQVGPKTVEFDLLHHPTWEDRETYEPEVINVIQRFVSPGDMCIDAGANLGFFTCLLSRLVGERGIVLSFEPEGASYSVLTKTISLNRLNNVACFKQALFSHDCEVNLWVSEHSGFSSLHKYKTSLGAERVEARALDTLLVDPWDHPSFIKLDCEGVEEDILRGAERILRRGVDCVVVELNFHLLRAMGRDDHSIRNFMHDLGYDLFLISLGDKKAGGFSFPVRVEPKVDLVLEGGPMINVMFSTRDKVEERWKSKDAGASSPA